MLLALRKVLLAKMHHFFNNGPPSCLHCVFYHFKHVEKRVPGPMFGFLGSENGALGTFEDMGRPILEWKACCRCLWCCLCLWRGALECRMRVNDVFCAVSFSGTMRSATSVLLEKNLGDLLHAHALVCHLLDGRNGPFSWTLWI